MTRLRLYREPKAPAEPGVPRRWEWQTGQLVTPGVRSWSGSPWNVRVSWALPVHAILVFGQIFNIMLRPSEPRRSVYPRGPRIPSDRKTQERTKPKLEALQSTSRQARRKQPTPRIAPSPACAPNHPEHDISQWHLCRYMLGRKRELGRAASEVSEPKSDPWGRHLGNLAYPHLRGAWPFGPDAVHPI
jgi:hypothetical protein